MNKFSKNWIVATMKDNKRIQSDNMEDLMDYIISLDTSTADLRFEYHNIPLPDVDFVEDQTCARGWGVCYITMFNIFGEKPKYNIKLPNILIRDLILQEYCMVIYLKDEIDKTPYICYERSLTNVNNAYDNKALYLDEHVDHYHIIKKSDLNDYMIKWLSGKQDNAISIQGKSYIDLDTSSTLPINNINLSVSIDMNKLDISKLLFSSKLYTALILQNMLMSHMLTFKYINDNKDIGRYDLISDQYVDIIKGMIDLKFRIVKLTEDDDVLHIHLSTIIDQVYDTMYYLSKTKKYVGCIDMDYFTRVDSPTQTIISVKNDNINQVKELIDEVQFTTKQ